MPTNPLVIAYHLMWTAYGWWLPNDPRGSTSHTIRNDLLKDLGDLHLGRKHVQPVSSEIRTFYQQAGDRLRYPLLQFHPNEFSAVAQVFGEVVAEHKYTCYACVVMPDHVHLIIRKHRHLAEQMIETLQSQSRSRLSDRGLRPPHHPTWTRGGWKVYLDHPDAIRRTIRYIEDNPLKMRLPRQRWSWITPYNGWPLHPGHSPNSSYAKALRAAGRSPH